MSPRDADPGRRSALRLLLAPLALPLLGAPALHPRSDDRLLLRRIPGTAEVLPAVGLGSWITFNVGDDPAGRARSTAVIRAFLDSGGRLIDSSPMYGSAQEVIGDALVEIEKPRFFSADKVWISRGSGGREQMERSRRLWHVRRFDLLQVHNLLAWEEHLPTLLAMKKEGRVRYVGITTSHGRRHGELEAIMRRQPIDFIQVTYNPVDREVEQRLLPLALDRGIGVIVNRPFQQGALIDRLSRSPLPALAREIGCRTWAQLVLKFILSHPAVTCVIPATTVPAHARENVDAARGAMPDESLRRRIVAEIERI